jgi:hypothetical protein
MTWGDPHADDASHMADYWFAVERDRAEPRLAKIEARLDALEQAVAASGSSTAGRPDPVADRLEGLLKIVRDLRLQARDTWAEPKLAGVEAELVSIMRDLGRDAT